MSFWREGNEAWVEIFQEPRMVELTGVNGDLVSYMLEGRPGRTTVDRLYRTQADYWDARAVELERLAADHRLKAHKLRGAPPSTTHQAAVLAATMLRFVQAVKRMRELQREYFRKRIRDRLVTARQAEDEVDRLLRDMERSP